MLSLQQLLMPAELANTNARLDAATWVDRRATAHGTTRQIKNNRQYREPLFRTRQPAN
jgi:predicted 2-oxoglutarate/Fe(II)-dependent dioxygenase YbiX